MPAIGALSINGTVPTPQPTAGPSVKHSIGQLGGHLLNALPGYSTLGSNITNPNVNYLGATNPGAPKPVAQPTSNVSAPQAPSPNLSPGDYGGTAAGTSYAQSAQDAAQKAAAVDYINRAYDVKLGGLQGQLQTMDPQEQAANLQVQNQWQNRMNDLNTGLAQGQRNLNFATDQVNQGKAHSLDDLSRMIQQAHMSYNNQLGAMGAGDSSAAGLINQALAGQASKNRGNVLQNANGQLGQIGMQQQDLQTSFEQSHRDIDAWKQSTLQDLITNFAQQRNQIRSAMQDADLSRQQQLAQYDSTLTQSVMDRLSQIESQTQQATSDLVSKYQNAFAPANINIDPNLQQYQVAPIDAGKLAQLQMPTQLNPESGGITALLKRLQDEQNGLSTGV